MSRPTTYQRVEASNDPSGETWLVREEFHNLRKARAFFALLREGHYHRVTLEKFNANDEHIGTHVWFKGSECAF